MNRIPIRRLIPYLAGALLVVGVGFWVLHSTGASSPGEGIVVLGGANGGSDLAGAGEESATARSTVSAGALGSSGLSGTEPGTAAEDTNGAAQSPANSRSATSTTASPLFVQVAGAVRRPGVYQMRAGSRVFEAVALAGGVTEEADEEALPLAALVSDGCRIVVPRHGEATPAAGITPGGPPPSGGGTDGGAPEQVSLSTGTAAELETLPGIGPKTAERIVSYREEHGPFSAVEDLDGVPGIGPTTVENLRGLVVP